MSATLIYGDHDAVLVDAWATFDQADAGEPEPPGGSPTSTR